MYWSGVMSGLAVHRTPVATEGLKVSSSLCSALCRIWGILQDWGFVNMELGLHGHGAICSFQNADS